MELRQLAYFKSIAEHGSINAAARSLHMSQPPLSYALNQLEAELGVTLFIRSAKGIELTDAGRLFYQHANDILNRSYSAIREVSMVGETQTLRIGVTPTVVPVVAPYLAQLKKKNANVMLELHEGTTYHLKESLDDGTLDAAFIRTPVNLQGCHYMQIKEEPMTAVFSTKNHLSSITLKQLQKEPLILYRRYEPLIQETFTKHHLEIHMVCECDDARTAIKLTEEGLGTAIVPMTIASTNQNVSVSLINAHELKTSILITWHDQSILLNSLLDLLKQ